MSYAQQSDIEAVFGPTNVAAWTLFETGTPDGATNTVRIEAALAYADGEVDAFFAGGPYAVPLTVETGAQPVSATSTTPATASWP
jgi:phage gp36-like protein